MLKVLESYFKKTSLNKREDKCCWKSGRRCQDLQQLEILTNDLDYYLSNLINYGFLLLGEVSEVIHGDTTRPTRSVAMWGKRKEEGYIFLFIYTGLFSYEKFLQKLTWRKLSMESNK